MAIIAGAALLNQLISALREWGNRQYRKGKHIEEDKSSVSLLKERTEDMMKVQAADHSRVRQIELDMVKNAGDIAANAAAIGRLTALCEDTQKYVRGAWETMVRLSKGEKIDPPPPG